MDLREPMALAAHAIPGRLDPEQDYRPWFMLRGRGGIPVQPEHASWDLGDMTGRYLESLILARHMGITAPELSQAEVRLERFLFKILGPDGLVHDPQSGAIDHSFSQGSAMFGLLAWFEDTHDPEVRRALERLISGQLNRLQRHDDLLVDPSVKLSESSGSHLAGYQIYPAVRFYELTGYPDALTLAEGLTRWAMADPVLGSDGAITKPLSWEGHIHSWLETLAGCARAARNSPALDRQKIVARCRATYDWVRRTNGTGFGWLATYPTGGSCETCGISSAIRLALELADAGYPQYFEDVERFVRNQVVAAQFKDLSTYQNGTNRVTPLLLGCFDSQSMPNGHLGTRGGEDVGIVEGCCLNGGMRALALAWDAIATADENGVTANLALSRSGPACDVIGYQPLEGRVDVVPRVAGSLRVRLPGWADPTRIAVAITNRSGTPARMEWRFKPPYIVFQSVESGMRFAIRFPLRELQEDTTAGGQTFHVRWKGDVVIGVDPPGQREPTYQTAQARTTTRKRPKAEEDYCRTVPDTDFLRDAARLAEMSMLARMDLQRNGQPFFRVYPFADPPHAEHEKWDDGDMSGRYVEALILSRRMTGLPIDSREILLRQYLASLFDPADGLCYTCGTAWAPRRACLFSQSSAMLGLLAWYDETGSAQARRLLDRQADGVMRIAEKRNDHVLFPKYEFDGKQYVDDPPGKNAPIWYGGRLILPLVDYWQISGRADVKDFLEKLIHYSTKVSQFIKPDGEVERGEGWWGHLHSTMDMAAGIAEFGRLDNRAELVEWARRVYDWIGRTHTTRYGWVADVSGGRICESCAIASRIRLGLILYRAGAADPFGEIDRYLRNQLLENQFVDTSFLAPLKPETPRTERTTYAGVDRMIRGTFQCWGTANDLIGHDDIEGCGAGGGMQGLALAWNARYEWRDVGPIDELRVHLLFNGILCGRPVTGFTTAAPIAAELWSDLPYCGRVSVRAHQKIPRLALRVPYGSDTAGAQVRRSGSGDHAKAGSQFSFEGQYAVITDISSGEWIELSFPLTQYDTVEHAAGVEYHVHWKGSSVLSLTPPGEKVPLYRNRKDVNVEIVPPTAPRYP